mmetsp:Transcript_6197/g.9034  ORF Transcript_6197/g.9034 Transcript_6197/m.9034 type:complete len:99 (-) Transcript_6197:363-659(-)
MAFTININPNYLKYTAPDQKYCIWKQRAQQQYLTFHQKPAEMKQTKDETRISNSYEHFLIHSSSGKTIVTVLRSGRFVSDVRKTISLKNKHSRKHIIT